MLKVMDGHLVRIIYIYIYIYTHAHKGIVVLSLLLQSGDEKCRVHQTSEDCPTCCAWHTDGSKFYVAGTRGQFFECVSPRPLWPCIVCILLKHILIF